MAILIPQGKQSYITAAGIPLVGGKVYTFDAGTNNPRLTFSDSAGLVNNANPVILDARGEATIFWSGIYKVILKDALDNTIWTVDNVNGGTAQISAANVDFLQSGVAAVVRTMLDKAQDLVSVFDFLTTAQKADVVARTATLDLTAPVQAAITAVAAAGGGGLFFPAGIYRISVTLSGCASVYLLGQGDGRNLQPAANAATEIAWYGGASDMVRFGWVGGSVKVNGGAARMRLNGRALANRCLSIKDFQHGSFDEVQLTGSLTDALYFTNTDGLDPTGFMSFKDLQISLRGGTTNAANGINIDGLGAGASGVTKMKFFSPRIEHANGQGLLFGARGDSNSFYDFFAFRASGTETGAGIQFASTSISAVNTTNKFLGSTIAVGGISIALPAAATAFIGCEGTSFESVNVTELAADLLDRFNPFTLIGKVVGHGKTDKRYRTGFNRIMNEYQVSMFDAMHFVAYTNPIVTTNQGSWSVVRNGAGGLIQSALQPGGALDLITGAAGTDDIGMYSALDFTSGITLSSNPLHQFECAPITLTNVRSQFGLFGDATLPDPVNGAYVQFDPAVNANYQLISRKAGAPVTITTALPGAAAKRIWLICVDSTNNVVFFTRLPTETQWTYLGIIAANTPVVPLLPGFRCRAQVAVNKDIHVYSSEFGYDNE